MLYSIEIRLCVYECLTLQGGSEQVYFREELTEGVHRPVSLQCDQQLLLEKIAAQAKLKVTHACENRPYINQSAKLYLSTCSLCFKPAKNQQPKL